MRPSKSNTKLLRRGFGAALALSMAAALSLGTGASLASVRHSSPKLIIGVIHIGSTKDAGYNQAQQAGISYLQSHMKGVKVLMANEIPETSEVTTVMQNMINQGAKLIFPMDFGYQSFAYALAQSNPKVDFEQPGGYLVSSNFGDYWANSDDVNYAAGVAAAKMSKTGKIGFIGAMPIPTILCSAIAFHLGAESVNPKITTTVIWTNAWSDPVKEAAAVNTLHADHVDVVGTLVDSPITIITTAGKDHMFVVAYHSATGEKYAPNAWLSAVAFNWGPLFVSMAEAVENGTWGKSVYDSNYVPPVQASLGGLKKVETAYLAPFGPKVTTGAKMAANAAMNLFIQNKLVNPYKGPIYDQHGVLRVAKGQYLTQAEQQNVDWLAKGMIGSTT